MDRLQFALAALALLATPGPTNTLLLTSGATAGFRRSARLLVAEMLGYAISISVLISALGAAMANVYGLTSSLQAACALYLCFAAYKLWIGGGGGGPGGIGFDRVFVTTLLNPKAFVFATTIIPGGPAEGLLARLPWLAALCVIIAGVGASWIYAGATTRMAGARRLSAGVCCRAGAAVLMAFAALLSWSAVASALNHYAGLTH